MQVTQTLQQCGTRVCTTFSALDAKYLVSCTMVFLPQELLAVAGWGPKVAGLGKAKWVG